MKNTKIIAVLLAVVFASLSMSSHAAWGKKKTKDVMFHTDSTPPIEAMQTAAFFKKKGGKWG